MCLNIGRFHRFHPFRGTQEQERRNITGTVRRSHLDTCHTMFIGCSSVFLIGTTQEHPGTTQESNETQDKWGCSGYFTPDTGTRERENTRREHRNTTRRMTSAWCNLVVPCWKLIGCIRDSPLASKHSVFLPGTLQTASFLLVPGTLRRTPLYLEARVFTPSNNRQHDAMQAHTGVPRRN